MARAVRPSILSLLSIDIFLGQIMVDGKAGKGDRYRKVDQKKWDENWELAFGKNKFNKKGKQNGTGRNKNRGTKKRS